MEERVQGERRYFSADRLKHYRSGRYQLVVSRETGEMPYLPSGVYVISYLNVLTPLQAV